MQGFIFRDMLVPGFPAVIRMADRLTLRGAQRWADEVLADTAEEPVG